MLSGCSRQQPRRAALQLANRVGGGRVARCRQADGTHRIPAMDRWLPGKKVFSLCFSRRSAALRNTVASRDGDRGSAVEASSHLLWECLHHIRIFQTYHADGEPAMEACRKYSVNLRPVSRPRPPACVVAPMPVHPDEPRLSCTPHRQTQAPSVSESFDRLADRSRENCAHPRD